MTDRKKINFIDLVIITFHSAVITHSGLNAPQNFEADEVFLE